LLVGDSKRTAASLTLAVSCLLATLFAAPGIATAAADPRLDGRERAMVRAINRQRAKHGVAKLSASRRLARAADFHSWEMLEADYFAHRSRDGGPFDERIRRYANHRSVGETLAMLGRCGPRAARRVVRMWMNSPGHRAILLSTSFRRVGLGRRTGDLGGDRVCVVTADFGSRK
jgi:uncharacterized protein YkwD